MTETPLLDELAVSEIEARGVTSLRGSTKRLDRILLTVAERDALCRTVKHLRHEGEVLRADLKYRCEALEELRRCRDRWLTALNPASAGMSVDDAIKALQCQLEQLRG